MDQAYKKKEIIVAEPMLVTDSFEDDMDKLLGFYRSVRGKNPELGIS